jgi:alpha-tubulin suppressor-like RCC1 family protein
MHEIHHRPFPLGRPLQQALATGVLAALTACGGGGGGGDAGGTTPPVSVTAPSITGQPQGGTRMVGQAFNLSVTASGSGLSYDWQVSSDGGVTWRAATGAIGAALPVPAVTMAEDGTRWRVRVSNSVGTVTSDTVMLGTTWGEVVTSADTSRLELVHGGGDGGTDGGGDGAGADGGGGLGKVLGARLTVTRVADGALIGSALTHPVTGLVRIKAGPGAGPFLLTLEGVAGATYFDEGKNALLPFGPGRVLHALVDRIDENLAVSPLTEAAYRYALNHYVADPSRVRAGTSPLLATGSVATLTAEQIRQANEKVRLEINRLLPQALQLPSVKSLPTPIDNTSAANALPVSRYGLAAVATGGLVRKANNYLPTATLPALELTEQLARDLTDGTINGFALDGTPASPEAAYYDVSRDAVELGATSASISAQFGSSTTLTLSPFVSDFTLATFFGNTTPSDSCEVQYDKAALTREGRLNLQRVTPRAGERCLSPTGNTVQLLQGFVSDVRFVRSISSQLFVVKNDGSVLAWGKAACGRLGEGSSTGRLSTPAPVTGLRDITSLGAGGHHGIARDKDGFVYTWGADLSGALGLGTSVSYDNPACDLNAERAGGPYNPAPVILRPRRVPGLSDIVSVTADQLTSLALDSAGRVYQWGSIATPSNLFDSVSVPTLVPGLSSISGLATVGNFNLALRADGTVWGWGANTSGQSADGTDTPKPTPVQIPGLADVVQIAGDSIGSAAALLRDGTVMLWDVRDFRRYTAPATYRICRVDGTGYNYFFGAGTCLSLEVLPFPKMRHVWGNGFQLTFIGLDGKVYTRQRGQTELLLIDTTFLGGS